VGATAVPGAHLPVIKGEKQKQLNDNHLTVSHVMYAEPLSLGYFFFPQ
jgi:hypothetical protein